MPGNWLDQQFRVEPGGTERIDIWLGTGDATRDYVPVQVSIFESAIAHQPLHSETLQIDTADPRLVSLRVRQLSPRPGLLILRLEPDPSGPSFVAGATKDDRYPLGRLWIGLEQAFADQDLVLTVFDRIPAWRWFALAAEHQRNQLVVYLGLQLALVMLVYAVFRRVQDFMSMRRFSIPLWWISLPSAVFLVIPAISAISIWA